MNADNKSRGVLAPTSDHKLIVHFPLGQWRITFETASEETGNRFSKLANRKPILVTISSIHGAKPLVEGWGIPFHNADDPDLEAVVNNRAQLGNDVSLLQFLQKKTFQLLLVGNPESHASFLASMLTSHCSNPFAAIKSFQPYRTWQAIGENPRKDAFPPSWRYVEPFSQLVAETNTLQISGRRDNVDGHTPIHSSGRFAS